MGRIAVVGGSNVDIQGFPINHLTLGDSNPGRIVITPGGVGRNVAENAARMGSEVRLISAFGDDEGAALLVKSLSDAGVDISASCVLDDHRSSSYLCILDESGRLHVAVSDMELAAEITPELVERGREAIEWSSVCVIDANLPSATIDHICRSFPARRVLLDSVSEAKAPRAAGSLGRLYAIKPNRREAEVLTGVSIRSDDDLPRAAERLHGEGITAVFISLGARGLFFSAHGKRPACGVVEAPSGGVVRNASGAGDAMTAAIAMGIAEEARVEDIARNAVAAAAIAMESELPVNPAIDGAAVSRRADRLSAAVW